MKKILIALMLFPSLSAICFAEATVLGVLENRVEPKEPAAVRAVFSSDGKEWRVWDGKCKKDHSCLVPKSWKVGFKGRAVGSFDPENSKAAPKVGKPSKDFGGFTSATTYRPLAAVFGGGFKNPEPWKEAKLNKNTKAKFITAFREKFPSSTNCESPEKNVENPWAYRDQDIAIQRVVSFKSGTLASLTLKNYRCDGPPENGFLDHLFLLGKDGKVVHFDQGLKFVDAADFDGDGKAEFLFAIDRYNQGGYKLYFDQLQKSEAATFSYH